MRQCETSKVGVDHRGWNRPYQFMDREKARSEHDIGWLEGDLQQYDESGYMFEYNLHTDDTSTVLKSMKDDLAFLKNVDWIDLQTRLITVSF